MKATKPNQIPALTAEERREALKKGLQARQKRAEVREQLSAGKITLEEVIETEDEMVKRMRVVDLLKAYKGIGERKAPRIMEELGIAQSRRIGGLGWKQKEKLLVFVAKYTNK